MVKEQLAIALELLKQEKVIAFPTDTVYGLGGDARSEIVINTVFALKQRPRDLPLPVLLPDLDQIYTWIDRQVLSIQAAKSLFNLLEDHWPGPLTVVIKKAAHVSASLTAGRANIALRIPDHPVALDLLKSFNAGIIGTSANISGIASAKTVSEVTKIFGEKLFVLTDHNAELGEFGSRVHNIGSTIVEFEHTTKKIKILREGALSKAALWKYI